MLRATKGLTTRPESEQHVATRTEPCVVRTSDKVSIGLYLYATCEIVGEPQGKGPRIARKVLECPTTRRLFDEKVSSDC